MKSIVPDYKTLAFANIIKQTVRIMKIDYTQNISEKSEIFSAERKYIYEKCHINIVF